MKHYTATVIKTGNSYALRVPKGYVDDNHLEQGQKVYIGRPVDKKSYDKEAAKRAIEKLQAAVAANPHGLASIKDPVAWQRKIREDRPLPGRDY